MATVAVDPRWAAHLQHFAAPGTDAFSAVNQFACWLQTLHHHDCISLDFSVRVMLVSPAEENYTTWKRTVAPRRWTTNLATRNGLNAVGRFWSLDTPTSFDVNGPHKFPLSNGTFRTRMNSFGDRFKALAATYA